MQVVWNDICLSNIYSFFENSPVTPALHWVSSSSFQLWHQFIKAPVDLPYVVRLRFMSLYRSWFSPQYSTEGKIKEPNLAAEAGRDVLSAVTSYARGDMGGVLRSAMGLVKTATGGAHSQKAEQVTKATRTSPADIVRNEGWVSQICSHLIAFF